MSTMVSNAYPFSTDFQSNLFGTENMDYGYSLNIAASIEKMPGLNNSSLANVWASQRSTSVPRRNSTSSVSSIAATRNRMNLNTLTSASNVIPESNTATLSAAASILNTVAEERFRGRAYSEGASSLSGEQMQPQQQPIASSRYKTELCRPFEENGKCKYGDKCQFAHGKQELRQLVRHPKYKTELCRTFHTSGFCPYGPRCHFIHNQEDTLIRGGPAMQSAGSNGNLHHNAAYNGMMASPGIPVPNSHISQRNHFDHRPSRLNVLTKQLSAGPTFGSLSYSPTNQSPLGGSPTFYQGDMSCSALMSPTSPNASQNGSMFNFNNLSSVDMPITASTLTSIMSNMPFDGQQSTPPMSTYDMVHAQGPYHETIAADDSAFDGPPTPPDSDRESMTGSPSSRQQRLPIFRCLSQSE